MTNHSIGLRGEKIALWFLRAKGYRLCSFRYKTKMGEVDLVMRRGKVLVFIEVKTRTALESGLEAISAQAQERIGKAALQFIQKHPQYRNYVWRFDAVVVMPRRLPYHLENAW